MSCDVGVSGDPYKSHLGWLGLERVQDDVSALGNRVTSEKVLDWWEGGEGVRHYEVFLGGIEVANFCKAELYICKFGDENGGRVLSLVTRIPAQSRAHKFLCSEYLISVCVNKTIHFPQVFMRSEKSSIFSKIELKSFSSKRNKNRKIKNEIYTFLER